MGEKVGVTEYAKMIGISREKVLARIHSGTLPATKVTEGKRKLWKIDLDKAKANPTHSPNVLPEGESNSQESELTKARTRTQRATADIKEMESKEKSGELVNVKEVEKQAFTQGRRTREAFTNLPARVAAEWASITDPHKLEALMAEEIKSMLTELSTPAGEEK